MVAAAISRAAEGEEPRLSHLRESGSIRNPPKATAGRVREKEAHHAVATLAGDQPAAREL